MLSLSCPFPFLVVVPWLLAYVTWLSVLCRLRYLCNVTQLCITGILHVQTIHEKVKEWQYSTASHTKYKSPRREQES
jgi:hypothetical protein